MTSEDRRRRRDLGRRLTGLSRASVSESLALSPANAAYQPARRIAFTGAPGAGKSTLISRFAKRRLDAVRDEGGVAVLAIDPTSPISGGSLLGDRIRMDAVAGDADLYIRSLPSRASSDGLADNIVDLLAALDAHGFREIILETVGVGQAEHAVRALVDTVVMVLHPESGDSVQAMKAGILEIADVYVVNKADLPGAAKTAAEMRALVKRATGAWRPPVITVAAGAEDGLVALDEAVSLHLDWTARHRDETAVHRRRRRHHLQSLITRRIGELLDEAPSDPERSTLREAYDELVGRLSER